MLSNIECYIISIFFISLRLNQFLGVNLQGLVQMGCDARLLDGSARQRVVRQMARHVAQELGVEQGRSTCGSSFLGRATAMRVLRPFLTLCSTGGRRDRCGFCVTALYLAIKV